MFSKIGIVLVLAMYVLSGVNKLLDFNGTVNITSQKFRDWCKKNVKNYFEIFINTPIEILKKRDYKKLYKNAFSGKIKNVVGVDIKFIKPKNPDLIINNSSTKRDLYLNYNNILKEIKTRKIKIY